MSFLTQLFGPPLQALRLLALWLIGRQDISFTDQQVNIPDDLSLGQYVLVAGLPALVFWVTAALGALLLLNAVNLAQGLLGVLALALGLLGGLSTQGDIRLILTRLTDEYHPPE